MRAHKRAISGSLCHDFVPRRVLALHFGHRDGGELVRKLYGHSDAKLARERVREVFGRAPAAPMPISPTSCEVA